MERRSFLKNGLLLSVGGMMASRVEMAPAMEAIATAKDIYIIFLSLIKKNFTST